MIIILSGGSQTKASTHCMIPFIKNSREFKLIYSKRKQSSGCLGMASGQGREQGLIAKGHKEIWGVVDIHYLDCGDGFVCMCVCENIKLYTKYMQCIVCQHA